MAPYEKRAQNLTQLGRMSFLLVAAGHSELALCVHPAKRAYHESQSWNYPKKNIYQSPSGDTSLIESHLVFAYYKEYELPPAFKRPVISPVH